MILFSKFEREKVFDIFRFKENNYTGIGGFPNDKNKNSPDLFDRVRNKYPDEQGIKFYYPDGFNKVVKANGKVVYHKDGFRYYKREWYKNNRYNKINYWFLDHRGLNYIQCKIIGEGKDKPQRYFNGDYFPEGRCYIILKSI
jgi:hypothetical protein